MMQITDLYQHVAKHGNLPEEYVEKMMHDVPDVPVVDRAEHLAAVVEGMTVLDLGSSGPMAELLAQKAGAYHAADIVQPTLGVTNWRVDFDNADVLPDIPDLDLVVASEVLEHLSNAGHFLDLVHRLSVPAILTVPNCFSVAGRRYMARAVECVNREHVAWYSYHTLKVLVERHGFRLVEWFWYNGDPLTAEGLIFHVKPVVRNG